MIKTIRNNLPELNLPFGIQSMALSAVGVILSSSPFGNSFFWFSFFVYSAVLYLIFTLFMMVVEREK
jgi:hypothetical protein